MSSTSPLLCHEIVFEAVKDKITPAEWRSYETYRSGPGFTPSTLDEIDGLTTLAKTGVLDPETKFNVLNPTPVYLSEIAFQHLNPSEAAEVEEEARNEQRNAEFGSW